MKQTLKKLSAFMMAMAISGALFAQVPQKFNYQGIARDTKGNPMAQQRMTLKLIVLPTSDATEGEYEEIQSVTTNEFGLYNLQIGNGTPVKGEMKTVKWETGNKYIKVAIDPKGGNDFVDAGTTQLLSVPYAIYADKAGMAKTTAGSDRAGTVSTSAAGTGTVNYLTKFTAANTIYNSQLFDNGTNVGIGTTTPSAKFHISQNLAGVQEHMRMQNLSTTGAGRFTLYSDGGSNYSTFTKYGSAYAGSYAGLAGLYPYGNLLAFGNNGLISGDGLGRFLISTAGSAGISIFKGGTSKLKFHADYASENVGIGGNAAPVSRVHLNNTDGTSMDVRLTNNTTGHTATDGMSITMSGNDVLINNRENASLAFGTNNIEQARIISTGDVGIGTTTPIVKLDVNGQIRMQGGAPGVGKIMTSDATGIGSWSTTDALGIVNGNGSTDYIPKFTASGTSIGNSVMIENSGNIGIGVVPSAKLHVSSSSNYVAQFNGIGPMYMGLFEDNIYRGYIGSYSGNAEDVDFGTGSGNSTGKLHLTSQSVPRLTIKPDGKVGIGTTDPSHQLQINGGDLFVQSSSGLIRFGYNGANEWQMATTNAGADLRWYTTPDGGSTITPRHYFQQNGNVGIGGFSGAGLPLGRLDVLGIGATSSTNTFLLRNSLGDTLLRMRDDGRIGIGYNGNSYGRTVNLGGTGVNFYTPNEAAFGGAIFPLDTALVLWSNSAANNYIVIQPSWGNTGIGTYSPNAKLHLDGAMLIGGSSANPATGYELSVDGEIVAESLVALNSISWPDYVFDENYKLMPLSELEKSIKENKHLPKIPAANIMETKGINLGDMAVSLTEKIEELTLYIIEFNKKNEELANKVKILEQQSKKENLK